MMGKKLFTLFVLFFLSISVVNAQESYTLEDVSSHNTESDCWMIFEDSVYDITSYIANHDKFLDIRDWCGRDMTDDFKDKAGEGRDHKEGTYSMLESYLIGSVTEEILEKDNSNPYNLVIPLLLGIFLYWIPFFIVKKKGKLLKFNGFWNSIMFLLLLIPSLGFGIFMMLRYRFNNLWDIDFDFMYWHVELSLFMGILAINHFIQRLNIYLKQIKM